MVAWRGCVPTVGSGISRGIQSLAVVRPAPPAPPPPTMPSPAEARRALEQAVTARETAAAAHAALSKAAEQARRSIGDAEQAVEEAEAALAAGRLAAGMPRQRRYGRAGRLRRLTLAKNPAATPSGPPGRAAGGARGA